MRIVNDCNVDDHLTALDQRWWSLFSVPSSPWSEMKGLRYVIALFHVALIARANIQNTIAVIIIVTVLTIASTLKTSTMVWPRLRMIDIFPLPDGYWPLCCKAGLSFVRPEVPLLLPPAGLRPPGSLTIPSSSSSSSSISLSFLMSSSASSS